MGWLSLYIDSSALPQYYIGRIGQYVVKLKRMDAREDGKWMWLVHIHTTDQSSNILSDKTYTDEEIQSHITELLTPYVEEQ